MSIKNVIKRTVQFAAGFAGAIALLVSVFLYGKRQGKKIVEIDVKADKAARKKESEIEKTSADVLVAGSDNASDLEQRKDELKHKYNSRADSITEELLHRRGCKGTD